LDITDIVGIRVITYFDNDVDIIAELVEKEFKIDRPNSIDKRKLEADKFGYMSLHYVASLSPQRLKLSENKKYKSLKFELQIRSILQHSWAEIEHDLGYKGEFTIPDFAKRNFHRIAALLETADIEFTRLKKDLLEYEKKIQSGKNSVLKTESINKITLAHYIKNSKILHEIDKAISSSAFLGLSEVSAYKDSQLNDLLLNIKELNISSFDQLNKRLKENKTRLVAFKVDEKKAAQTLGKNFLIKGASISILQRLIAKK
jgi:hypothetical protein